MRQELILINYIIKKSGYEPDELPTALSRDIILKCFT